MTAFFMLQLMVIAPTHVVVIPVTARILETLALQPPVFIALVQGGRHAVMKCIVTWRLKTVAGR